MKVLLVSEDPEQSGVFYKYLKESFHTIEMVKVADALAAEEHLAVEDEFVGCFVDVALEKNTPSEIFDEINRLSHSFPVILFGPVDLLKSRAPDNLYDSNPANGLLESPVDKGEFVEAIQMMVAWFENDQIKKNTVEVDPDDYVAMKIKNFYRFSSLPFDAFVLQSESRFTRIIKKNKPYQESLVQKFVKRGKKHIYLEKVEQIEFFYNTMDKLIEFLRRPQELRPLISAQVKAVGIIHEHLRLIGVNENVMELTRLVAQGITVHRNTFRKITDLLRAYGFDLSDCAERATLCGHISMLVLRKMGFESETSDMKLAYASILHDFMQENDDLVSVVELSDPRLQNLSQEEYDLFIGHSLKEAEVCRNFSGAVEMDYIVARHHEMPFSRGFPQGLNSHQVNTLTCTFIVVNNFVNILSEAPNDNEYFNQLMDKLEGIYCEGHFRKPIVTIRGLL